MPRDFQTDVDAAVSATERLRAMSPVQVHDLPERMPARGVYLLSEGEDHQYVGRSDRLRSRILDHSRSYAQESHATFAMRLAREEITRDKPSYKLEGSRKALLDDPVFREAFERAKQRIGQMSVRYIEEADPIRQTLLEVCVAITLETKHNDFGNH